MAEPATDIQTNFKAAGYWATVMAPPTSEKYRPTNTTTNTKKPKNDDALTDWEFYELYNVINYLNNNNLYFASNQPHFTEPKAANGPADVNGQVLAGATAGGLMTLAPAVKVEESPEAPLMLDQSIAKAGGNQEYLKLWTDAKANANLDAETKAFLKTVDASIFAQELSEDTLENNKGFLNAAKILYNDENSDKSSGELSWDEHIAKKAAEEGWGVGLPEDEKAAIIAQRAEQELGEWAIDHMAKINDQSAAGLMAAWDIKEKSASVQLATLYMMQAFDHKKIDWKESPLRFAMNVATDPVNILFTVGGFILAPVTGGGSIVAAGSGVTARQISAGIIRQGVVKALQSHVAKTVLKAGAIGSLEAVAEDYGIQHTLEQAGYRKLGDNHDYTLNRTLTTAATGFATGGALTGLGYGAGKLIKKPKPEAPTPTSTDVANEAIEETAEEALESTAEKAAKETVEETLENTAEKAAKETADTTPAPTMPTPAANQPEAPNAFNNAANNTGSTPTGAAATPTTPTPQQPTTPTTEASATPTGASTTQTTNNNNGAGNTGATATASAQPSQTSNTAANNTNASSTSQQQQQTSASDSGNAGTSIDDDDLIYQGDLSDISYREMASFSEDGIPTYNYIKPKAEDIGFELPDYKESRNHLVTLISRNPSLPVLPKFSQNAKAARMDATPIIREIVNTVDDRMQHYGLTKAIMNLQKQLDDAAALIEKNPSAQKRAEILSDVKDAMDTFSRKNKDALESFDKDMRILRNHIEKEFMPHRTADGQLTGARARGDGRYHALVHEKHPTNGEIIKSHVNTLMDYVGDMSELSVSMQDLAPSKIADVIANLTPDQKTSDISNALKHSLNQISEKAEQSAMRIDQRNYLENRNIVSRALTPSFLESGVNSAEVRDQLIRGLDAGYYNPHRHNTNRKPGAKNLEHPMQNLEARYLKYTTDNKTSYPARTSIEWANYFKKEFYDQSRYEGDSIFLIERLVLKRYDDDIEPFPLELTDHLKGDSRYNTDPQYTLWVDNVDRTIAQGNKTGAQLGATDAGRAAEAHYASAMEPFIYSWRFRDQNRLATPGRIYLRQNLIFNPISHSLGFFTGASDMVQNTRTEGWLQKNMWAKLPQWKKAPEDGVFKTIGGSLWRATYRVGTAGLTTSLGRRVAYSAAGFYGVGTGLDYAGDYINEEYENAWLGGTLSTVGDSLQWTGKKYVQGGAAMASAVFYPTSQIASTAYTAVTGDWDKYSFADGLDYSPAQMHWWAADQLDTFELSTAEAAEILSDFRDHNGYNPYDDIEPAKRRALIAQMVEDNQADPTGYDIQTLKVELTEEEKKKAKEEADAKAKADAEANGASTSPSTSGSSGTTSDTPEGNSSPTLADAQNVASGAWDSVGNIFNAGANGALGSFDWMLTGKDAIGGGHLAADFKNAGSGFFNWIGDTWSDLANNRIKGGQKWLSFGLALLAAFPVMGFASAKLGALNIGGIPALIIGALTVGFGGGLINKLFKGQGNGSHVTTDVKQNTEQSVDHSGKDNTPKPPKPAPARVEDFSFKIKGKDAVLSDEDDAKTKGQDTLTYAVVQGGGKTNHVALSIVSNKDDAKKIVEQGQCTYVPFNLNPARGQTFDTTIEGVNHAGNEGKFAVFQGQDASNDPNAVCFELKAG